MRTICAMSSKTAVILVSALLPFSVRALANSGPFYSYQVGGTAGVNTPASDAAQCFSPDGNIPTWAAGLVLGGLTKCLVGSSFNDEKKWEFGNYYHLDALLSGNQTGISVKMTFDPECQPGGVGIPGCFDEGVGQLNYAQQFDAPPGSTVTGFSFTLTGGNAAAGVSASSDCPDPGGPDCGLYTASAGGTYTNGPPAGKIQFGPIKIGPSGHYVLVAGIYTSSYQEFQVGFNPPRGMAINFGCGFSLQLGGNGKTTMMATATPIGGLDLADAAKACGYEGFDWQQTITSEPCPSAIFPNLPGKLPGNFCPLLPGQIAQGLTVGPKPDGSTAPTFLDPPEGGYTYAPLDNPYMFYYDINVAESPGSRDVNGGGDIPNETTMLMFYDTPRSTCLPTLPPPPQVLPPIIAANLQKKRTQYCGGPFSTAPTGSFLGFTTSLVGISLVDASPSPPLIQWTWISTFNGTAGGVTALKSPSGPVDPDSGVGNITITSVNGATFPPIIPPSQIATTASGLAYSRVTQTFNGTITITNIGGSAITTPSSFQVVVTALPAGVTLTNAVGVSNLNPYVTVPAVTSLAPGQSVMVPVQFYNPMNAAISFTPEVYAGTLP